MALTTEFITAAQIITQAKLSVDFDEDKLNPYIIVAQRRFIRPLLGEDYYESLQDTFGSLSSDDQTLIDNYIQPSLAYYTIYESLQMNQNGIENAGVVTNDFELGSTSSREDFGYTKNTVRHLAEDWGAEIARFIKNVRKDDSTKYPLYNCEAKPQSKYGFITYESKGEINSKPYNNIINYDYKQNCCD